MTRRPRSRAIYWIIGGAGALAGVYAAAAMRPAGTFRNGSFEADFEGWRVAGAPEIAVGRADHPASDGAKVVVFNAHDRTGTGSDISQTFATTPGQRYRLSFDAGVVGAVADQQLRVTVEGQRMLLDTTVTIAGLTPGPFYVPHHVSFVADDDRATVTFADRSATYVAIDALLDNVRIAAEHEGAPRVVTQPTRQAVAEGEPATFEVTAAGRPPLAYQWHFNGRPIPGATESRYVVEAGTSATAGNYSATVSNGAGAVTTSGATLTVLPQDIVANGSFEYGSARWAFSERWVSPSTNTAYGVTDGRALVHFNWGQHAPGGRVSQTFETEPGHEYALTFDVGAYSTSNRLEQRIRVQVAGVRELLSQDVAVRASGRGGSYERQRYRFVADSSRTTLTFTDISTVTQDIDALLDNVEVEDLTESGHRAAASARSTR